MVDIKIFNGEIILNTDEIVENEKDLLNELNRVLCFTISVYKRRIEKIKGKNLTEIDEVILNYRIMEAITMIPLDEVREIINE